MMTQRAPLFSQNRAFRWNQEGDVDGYSGVDVRSDDLVWYTWSHIPGPQGGRQNERTQTHDDFVRNGPPPRPPDAPVPVSIIAAVRSFIAEQP